MTLRDSIRRSSHAVSLAIALLVTSATGSALAANFTPTTTKDGVDQRGCVAAGVPCTLRDAVIAANAAPGSTINLPAGTYDLTIGPGGNDDATTGDLNVTAATTITGSDPKTTIIDGGGDATTVTDRVFRVESSGVLEMSGVTIQHGHPAGGAAFPLSDGGGILALGALKLTDATVQDNFVDPATDQRSGAGAGIAQGASVALALTRVNVLNNQVVVAAGKLGGGGGLLLAGGDPGTVTIADSNISLNTAAGPGGGIYSSPIANGGSITITGTTISSNHAQLPPNINDSTRPHASGGGIASDGAIPITLTTDTIGSNTADQSGGGIFDNGASIYTITDSSIVSNAAVAGFTSSGGDSRGGGGITADGGTPNPGWVLNRDLIALNTAGDGNHPNVPGGGIDEDGGDTFTVVNTTIFNNTATGVGGGYESNGGGTHTLTNDTIDSNNAGPGSGGNIDNSGGAALTLANTIVAHGFPVNCAASNGSAPPTSHDHNLETTNTCGFGGSDLINTDPKLAGLGINGGRTLTLAVLPGSPAIDAGDNAMCPPTDQRGISRSENAVCDIGAFELRHTIGVTNTNDSGPGSLRDAIAASDSGTTIVFAPALNGQTIHLTAGLVIPHSLTISGPGASQLTVDGGNNVTLFNIEADQNADSVTISGLKLTGGGFTSSGSNGGGGAVFGNSVHDLTLNGDTITGNSANVDNANHGGGGGVYANGSNLTVTNSTITGNTVTITTAHGAGHGGGGIFSNAGTTVVSGSLVSGNSVTQSTTSGSGSDGGGGIYDRGGDLSLAGSSVENNSDTIDIGNSSDGGGGVYEDGDTLTIASSKINGNGFTLANSNSGVNGGGGVYNDGGAVLITSSSLDDNSATVNDTGAVGGADGGIGLYSDGGQLTIVASTIANNAGNVTATGGSNGGGALYDQGINTTYLNSTLSGNSITINSPGQQNGGGAIHGFGNAQGHVSISDTTIAGNSANQPGGAIFDQADIYAFKNTIVSGNSGSPAGDCAGAGPFNSAGSNLSTSSGCGFGASGDLTNADPKLGPLQDNGGPTPTRALPVGSPAVDAGSCTDVAGNAVATDQRGTARPQPTGGKCDIGAFELAQSGQQPPPPHQSAPATQTGPPAGKTSTAATLAGSINPEGQATTYLFQYGLDPGLRPPGASTALYDQSTAPQSLPGDTSTHAVSALIANLVPNALYHARLVATNATGTVFGRDQTFTTSLGAPPAPPVLGGSEDGKPVSGHVFVLIAGRLVPFTEATKLPSGTVLDTRSGSLQLTAAAPGHKTITGIFGGAIFKLTQARNGLTTLSLVEGAFKGAPTYASCRARHASDPAGHAALSGRVLQSLRSRASGRFRTRGRYAAGTVRGTRWTTTDRCDGTLIAVQQHSVLVTDLVKHVTVLVTAGHHYLARPRK